MYFRFKAGLDKEKQIHMLSIKICFQTGSYDLLSKEVIDRICYPLLRTYKCRNILIEAEAVLSPGLPADGGPLLGMAHSYFSLEQLTRAIAEMVEENLYTWKENNIISHPKLKKKTAADEPIRNLMEIMNKESDFFRKYSAYEQERINRKSRPVKQDQLNGIGMALSYSGNNFIRPVAELTGLTVSMLLDKEGKLFIRPSTCPNHLELYELWRKKAAEFLGIDRKDIYFITETFSGASILSRNVSIVTELIEKGCQLLQKKRFREPLPIEVKKAYVNKGFDWDTDAFSGEPFPHVSAAVGVVEITINKKECIPRIKNIRMGIDCGEVLDINIARSIVESEILRSLAVFHNNAAEGYDILKTVFPDYLPPISVNFVKSRNPYGGIEGLASSTIPSSLVQAVNQALDIPLDQYSFDSMSIRERIKYED